MSARYLLDDGPDPDELGELPSCPECGWEDVVIEQGGILCRDCGARPTVAKSRTFGWTAGPDGWVTEPWSDFELEFERCPL